MRGLVHALEVADGDPGVDLPGRELEKIPLRDKRELLAIIDTYLERYRCLQKAS